VVWLNRAAPRAWLEDGKKTFVQNTPTRWGKISYFIESHIENGYISARIAQIKQLKKSSLCLSMPYKSKKICCHYISPIFCV